MVCVTTVCRGRVVVVWGKEEVVGEGSVMGDKAPVVKGK